MAKLTEELKSKVQPITASMEDTLESVNRVVAENEKDFRETMSNLRESTALARGFVGKLDKVPQQLEEGLKVLTGAGKSVDALIADNRTNLDLMIDDLRETASGAATLVSEVKRRPWRLLYKPSVDEMKALELYDAAWAYNIGAAELYRSVRVLSDRLRQSSDGDDEEAEQLVKLAMEQVRASLRSQRRAEEAFWKRLGEGE